MFPTQNANFNLLGYDTRRDFSVHATHHHIHHHNESCHIPVSFRKVYKCILSQFPCVVNSFFNIFESDWQIGVCA